VRSRGSQCNETLLVRAAVRPGKKLGLQSAAKKTCSDGDARTNSGRLFQTDAAAAGNVRSPMVARTVRGARKRQTDRRNGQTDKTRNADY